MILGDHKRLGMGILGFLAGIGVAKMLHSKMKKKTIENKMTQAAALIDDDYQSRRQSGRERCFFKRCRSKAQTHALEQNGESLIYGGITESYIRLQVRELGIDTNDYKKLSWMDARKIRRGKPLPADIDFQMAPPALLAILPVYPDYEWIVVGKSLALIYMPTGMIADVYSRVL